MSGIMDEMRFLLDDSSFTTTLPNSTSTPNRTSRSMGFLEFQDPMMTSAVPEYGSEAVLAPDNSLVDLEPSPLNLPYLPKDGSAAETGLPSGQGNSDYQELGQEAPADPPYILPEPTDVAGVEPTNFSPINLQGLVKTPDPSVVTIEIPDEWPDASPPPHPDCLYTPSLPSPQSVTSDCQQTEGLQQETSEQHAAYEQPPAQSQPPPLPKRPADPLTALPSPDMQPLPGQQALAHQHLALLHPAAASVASTSTAGATAAQLAQQRRVEYHGQMAVHELMYSTGYQMPPQFIGHQIEHSCYQTGLPGWHGHPPNVHPPPGHPPNVHPPPGHPAHAEYMAYSARCEQAQTVSRELCLMNEAPFPALLSHVPGHPGGGAGYAALPSTGRAPSEQTRAAAASRKRPARSPAVKDKPADDDPQGSANSSRPGIPYVELISQAILSTPKKRMLISEIYKWLMDQYDFFTPANIKSWRNSDNGPDWFTLHASTCDFSVRHNLSLMKCFVKGDKAPNGRGFYWSIDKRFEGEFENSNFHAPGCKERKKSVSRTKADGNCRQRCTAQMTRYATAAYHSHQAARMMHVAFQPGPGHMPVYGLQHGALANGYSMPDPTGSVGQLPAQTCHQYPGTVGPAPLGTAPMSMQDMQHLGGTMPGFEAAFLSRAAGDSSNPALHNGGAISSINPQSTSQPHGLQSHVCTFVLAGSAAAATSGDYAAFVNTTAAAVDAVDANPTTVAPAATIAMPAPMEMADVRAWSVNPLHVGGGTAY